MKHGKEVKVPLDAKVLRYAYPKNGKVGGIKVETKIDKLEAPVKKGDKVGKFYIYANKELVGKGGLYAGKDVEKGWFPSYIYMSNRLAVTLLIVILVILLLGFVLEKSKNSRKSKKLV